jgi:hypothetical protein
MIVHEKKDIFVLYYGIELNVVIHHSNIIWKNVTKMFHFSKTTQNQFISIIGNLILKQVIEEMKSA